MPDSMTGVLMPASTEVSYAVDTTEMLFILCFTGNLGHRLDSELSDHLETIILKRILFIQYAVYLNTFANAITPKST